jgi:hypothetical protein
MQDANVIYGYVCHKQTKKFQYVIKLFITILLQQSVLGRTNCQLHFDTT